MLGFVPHTALLLKINLPEAEQWAAEAYMALPGNPSAAATCAYALHLQDRDKQGIAILEELPRAALARPSLALYYGVLLASLGKTTRR